MEKVPGVHHDDILSFFAQVFQEGSPPGQTAKLAPPSAAGLVLPVQVRAEHQGDDLLGLRPGRLPPRGERDQAKEKNNQIFLHPYLPKTRFKSLMLSQKVKNTPSPSMGEGWGEGEDLRNSV
jgi:hypothetical protein